MLGLRSMLAVCFLIALAAPAQTPPPDDPFADIQPAAESLKASVNSGHSFFSDNFAFKKEIVSQFDTTTDLNGASRQSVGFEVAKKFSTETSTIASFDFQGRLVRRDGYNAVPNEMEGMDREGWAFEYHNVYVDLYNIFKRLGAKGVGRFNFRAGRFYVPFGLNLQTDTHGTLLQLSNGGNFGFERDWGAGFWGSINKHLNYDVYYLAGSGYGVKFKGQSGLGALRISLGNKYSSERGLEGGVSLIGGERLAQMTLVPLKTQRVGADARYRHTAPHGLLTITTELSGGRDAVRAVTTQLAQAEYLHSSRRWSVASQYRRFSFDSTGVNSSAIGEVTWFFRNDVANTNSHWIKFNVERQISSVPTPPRTIVTLQYYFYL